MCVDGFVVIIDEVQVFVLMDVVYFFDLLVVNSFVFWLVICFCELIDDDFLVVFEM